MPPPSNFHVTSDLYMTTSWDGVPLFRAANASNGLLLQCTYYAQGSMQTESKTCPPSIYSFKSPRSDFDCIQTDLKQSPLSGASTSPTAENLTCVYSDAALGTYSQFTGTLSTGDGACSLTASSSADCPVSSSVSPLSPILHRKTNPNSNDLAAPAPSLTPPPPATSSSTPSNAKLSPALIDLIALNSILVLAVLSLAGSGSRASVGVLPRGRQSTAPSVWARCRRREGEDGDG
ncbi:hypothetical protein B0H19DRAFT_1187836 [Mycena capillaripes]|nr:hypothetical protein B0H19DRAFT_1187836 [Mycena capillaripes]